MENKYLLKPITGTVKEGFTLVNEEEKVVYECQMLKFKLFGASPFHFTNHLTNKREEHTVSKTVTMSESGIAEMFSTKSSFKYDGKNIWDYLHELGIRINSSASSAKLGMTYEVSFKGNHIATIASTTPKGKSIITTGSYYDVICDENNLDLVFLVAFSIAKTEQVFYN